MKKKISIVIGGIFLLMFISCESIIQLGTLNKIVVQEKDSIVKNR